MIAYSEGKMISLASNYFKAQAEIPVSDAEDTNDLCQRLAAHWLRCAAPFCGVAIERDSSYWHWRYFSVPGTFKYVVFGDDSRGYAVARIEKCGDGHMSTGHTALRIVELLPSSSCAWNGGCDANFASLIVGMCLWAQHENSACVADFWCTSTRFAETLHAAGFLLDTVSHGVPMIFGDTSLNRSRINACILLNDEDRANFDWENTYFTKTTGDSDRPTLKSRAV